MKNNTAKRTMEKNNQQKEKQKYIPIVEKNDLSPHSATKTRANVANTVLAIADSLPLAPSPATASSA